MGEVGKDDMLITAGCNQAFCSVIDSLCQAGDEVIVPLPCYFNHQMWLSTRGVMPRYVSFNADTAMPDVDEARGIDQRPHARAVAGDAEQPQRRDLQPGMHRGFLRTGA